MDSISGNVLVFTDQHFGVKSNSPSRQKICAMVMKKVIDAVVEHDVSTCIFCGDFFHQRNALTIDTLNIAHRCLQALAKKCKVYMILGNHDLFNKNSTDINSISIFNDISNLHIVDATEEVDLNGHRALMVPWLGSIDGLKTSSYDMMFGHFDVSAKFIVSNYENLHSRGVSASEEASKELDKSLACDGDTASNGDEIASIVDLVKPDSIVFAGHIHQHKEMVVHGRKFIFVGSPYEQNLGDIGCRCGFYIVSKSMSSKFVEITGIPKHVKIECSKVLSKGIDSYDFSNVKGNIVQKVYDIDINADDDMKINHKIASASPYEELVPDYKVAIDFTSEDKQDNVLAATLKKSKLDYIKSYIEQLDTKMLEEGSIDKHKLFVLMSKYYNDVAGE